MKIRRAQFKKAGRGFSLLEMLVVMAMFSVITTALVIFYQSADVEFSQSMSTMSLSQTARQVAIKIIPYASVAVPAVPSAPFIFSPTQTGTGSNPAFIPNIYNLDFSTANDLLIPGDAGQMAHCRPPSAGSPVIYYRYRIRFDPATGLLWLEEVKATDPTSGALPAVYNPDGLHQPRLLGRNIQQLTFNNDNNAIQLTLTIRSILRNGGWLDGTIHRTTMGRVKDQNPLAANSPTRGSEYTLFSTIFIPYYSGQ